jgi:hypothetical protein
MPTTTHPPRWLLTVDALAAAFGLLALGTRLFGGFLLSIGPIEISARSPLRLVLMAVALLGLAWLVERGAPPWRRWSAHAARFSTRYPALAAVLPLVISSRALVLLLGFVAVKVIGFPPTTVARDTIWPDEFINLPWRWDTGWYTSIALKGYAGTLDLAHLDLRDEQSIVFFPAYPLLMRLTATLMLAAHSDVVLVWSGVLVSWLAFTAAAVYTYRLTRELLGDSAAPAAVLFLAMYPFAVFYSTAYSESLFLLVNIAAFYHFRHRQFIRAGLFGLVSGLTRPNGCLLSVALAILLLLGEWADRDRAWRKPSASDWMRGLAAASMPGIGLLIYCAYMWQLTGDPFIWVKAQQAWGRDVHLGDPRLALQFASPRFLLDAAALIFSLAALWPIARKLGVSYACWTAANVLLPFLNGGLLSVGRFTAVQFPLFILLGGLVSDRWRPLVAALFAMGQGLVTASFFTGRPLY